VRRRRRRDPARIGGSIAKVLDELGHGLASRSMQLAARWEESVGAELAAHCEPVALRGPVLEVAADSPVWSQQLQLRQEEILRALAATLGSQAPTQLRLRVR